MKPSTTRKRLTIAFIASLGANMLLGGYILRHVLDHRGPPSIDSFVEHMASGLPAADADILRRAFQENRDALTAEDQWRAGFHDRIASALQAEPFDPVKLSSVFSQMDRHDVDMHGLMQRSLVKAASEMSAEGRRTMAKFKP